MNKTGKEFNKGVIRLVNYDLRLAGDSIVPENSGIRDVRRQIENVITYLLEKDFEQLLNVMYRLDIHEEKFKEVIDGLHGNNISGILADLIIEREIRKAETRNKYSS